MALSEDSEPEPDLAVVPWGDYRDEHPTTALLVIEVADTSLEADRSFKADEYAAAGVPEYRIVDVRGRTIEVCRDPQPTGYRQRTIVQRCAPLAFAELEIGVEEILGRAGR